MTSFSLAWILLGAGMPRLAFSSQTPEIRVLGHAQRTELGAASGLADWSLESDLEWLDGASATRPTRAELAVEVWGQSPGQPLVTVHHRFTAEEAQRCLASRSAGCQLDILPLPIELAPLACRIQLAVLGADGSILSEPFSQTWGDCHPAPAPLFPGKTPDLDWNPNSLTWSQVQQSQAPFPREPFHFLSSDLENFGAGAAPIGGAVAAFGYDSQGRVIWTSLVQTAHSLNSGAALSIPWAEPVMPWQWHELCQVRLIADPWASLLEADKSNNELWQDAGLCEPAPGAHLEDLPDLVPEIVHGSSDGVVLRLFNAGRMAAPWPGQPIEISLRAKFPGESLWRNWSWLERRSIAGYGGELELMPPIQQSTLGSACAIELSIDPSSHQLETNHENDIVSWNQCH